MNKEITQEQKEFEKAWKENAEVQEFLYQEDIAGTEEESLLFVAAWYMWKQAKGIE